MTDFNSPPDPTPPLLGNTHPDPLDHPQPHPGLSEEPANQYEGSLLLDSINAYLGNSESHFQTIKQASEVDQYEHQRNPDTNPALASNIYASLPGERTRSQMAPFGNQFYEYEVQTKEPPLQSILSIVPFFKLASHQPNNGSLSFSHYKTKLDESLTKTEINSSLIVEFSNEKQPPELTEDSPSPQHPPATSPLDPPLSLPEQPMYPREREGEEHMPSRQMGQVQGVRESKEEQKAVDAISNQSVDSNLIINRLPLHYIVEEILQARMEKGETNIQQALQHQQLAPQEEPMQIQHISLQAEQPMDIENSCPVIPHPNLQIPMEIESIGFNGSVNIIAIDPIQSQASPAEDQERFEEQEIIDCITVKPAEPAFEREGAKEFTFGKMQFQANPQGKVEREAPRGVESDEDHADAPQDLSINYINNLSNQTSLCVEANNLSLNMEHENDFEEVLREIEELPQHFSLKNEAKDLNASESLLVVQQDNPVPPIEAVNNYIPPAPMAHCPNKNEYKPTEQVEITQNNNPPSDKQPQQQHRCTYTVIINEPKAKTLHQGATLSQTIFPCEVLPLVQNEGADKRSRLSYSNVCNYTLGNEAPAQRLQPLASRKDAPQVVIHNDNYHLPHKAAAPQQNHDAQRKMQTYPCININFRNNEMSVSIVGPAITFPSGPANKLQAPVNLNQTPEPVSFENANQSNNSLKGTQSFMDSSLEENQCVEKGKQKNDSPSGHKSSQSQLKESGSSIEQRISFITSILQKYHNILKQSQKYLLEFKNCSEENHREFELLLKAYVLLRFTPEPKNEVGVQLFKNGLFLIALVKLVTRFSQTPFLACYAYDYLHGAYGHTIDKNSYVFKSEYERARANYEAELEKKYSGVIVGQKGQGPAEEPVKRRLTAENNIFTARKSETKDSYSQMTPKKVDLAEERKQKDYTDCEEVKSPLKAHEEQQTPGSKTKKTQAKTIEPVPPAREVPPPQVESTPSKRLQEQHSTRPEAQKGSKKKELGQMQVSSEDASKANERSSQLRLKKNIDEIKNGVGSSGKKQDTQEASHDQSSKFSELYLKYRKIRENKKSDLPIENSSIKRTIVEDALRTDHPEKRPSKKVVFTDEVIVNNPIDNEESMEEEMGRRRKKKRSRSKKEDSVEKSEQEEGGLKRRGSKK